MKRLLPLLFLVPSVALLLYAKRDADEAGIRVRIETSGFEFTKDAPLWVTVIAPGAAVGDEPVAVQVEDGQVTLPNPVPDPATLGLYVAPSMKGKAGATWIPVGEPQTFESGSRAWILVVTPEECRAALALLRESD